MLHAINDDGSLKEINYIPHKEMYDLWRSRLTVLEYDSIVKQLDSLIEGEEIKTAGWIPGNDWSDTVYEPIYSKACNYNEEQSGLCFGLFVWVVFMEREDHWSFGHYKANNIPIRSMTYFKIRI